MADAPAPRHSIAHIREVLSHTRDEDLSLFVDAHAGDERAGVHGLVSSALNRIERHRSEYARLQSLYALEAELAASGHALVAGFDEVGRGALAGPLTVGAVILPSTPYVRRLDDSKALSPRARAEVAAEVHSIAVAVSIVHVPPARIDAIGISAALREGLKAALSGLPGTPGHCLLDGLPLSVLPAEKAIVKGDSKCACIAAASVVAKVARDALMVELEETYPGYGFAHSKGYGSSDHMDALSRMGPCEVHRLSFAPLSHRRLF